MSQPSLEIGTNSLVRSGVLEEEKSFIWKIEDFDLVRNSDKFINAQAFQFTAGSTIGLPTTWSCYLRDWHDIEDSSKRFIAFFFKLLTKPEDADEVNISYTVNVRKAEGGYFYQGSVKWRDMIPTPASSGWGFLFIDKGLPLERLPLLNGALVIEVDFKLYALKLPRLGLSSKVQAFERKATEKLKGDLGKSDVLTGSNVDSVTTIISKDNGTFPVNRGILSARSSVFQRMFQFDMKENKTGKVEIDDLSGKTVKVLLHYICTGMLHDDWKSPEVIEELPYAAKKYDLELLTEFLDDVLGEICTKKNATRLLVLAKRLDMKKAESELLTFVKNNAESADDLVFEEKEEASD